jgi:glycosyltransferase involved in cell wall biosynthesis
MNSRLSVLVTPRDSVPYQELLYRGVEALGVRVRYLDGPTPSQTLNVLCAPGLLVWWRVRGFRILHLHWVFQFSLPWARRAPWARRLMEWWFGVYLRVAQLIGLKVIWTAHDLLPHEQIFANDVRARETLLSRATVVIALSEVTAKELRELGARRVDIIPHGPFASPYPVTMSREEARSSFGFDRDDVVVALLGRIEKYKGADLLLLAAAQLPPSSKVKILLVGACTDEGYEDELRRLTGEAGSRVTALFEWVPVQDVARYLQSADFAVFPFRRITNSGSVILAQSFGLPIVITDLPSLSDIPQNTAIRFEPGVTSLVTSLLRAEAMSELERREMGEAGRAWSARSDWDEIALATVETYRAAIGQSM